MSKAGAGEILSEKISQLSRSVEVYRAAFDRYTGKRFERDLEGGVTQTCLQAVLEQDLLSRREEVADTVKQAEAQLMGLRVMEDLDKRSPLPPAPNLRSPKLLVTAPITRGLPKALPPAVPGHGSLPCKGPPDTRAEARVTLSEKTSRLRRLGEECRTTIDRYRRSKLGPEGRVAPTCATSSGYWRMGTRGPLWSQPLTPEAHPGFLSQPPSTEVCPGPCFRQCLTAVATHTGAPLLPG